MWVARGFLYCRFKDQVGLLEVCWALYQQWEVLSHICESKLLLRWSSVLKEGPIAEHPCTANQPSFFGEDDFWGHIALDQGCHDHPGPEIFSSAAPGGCWMWSSGGKALKAMAFTQGWCEVGGIVPSLKPQWCPRNSVKQTSKALRRGLWAGQSYRARVHIFCGIRWKPVENLPQILG